MTIPASVYRLAGAAVALLSFHGAISAAPAPRYGVFVYANFCVSAMSGDLYGSRITLLRSADGDVLVYEYDDGSRHALAATDLKFGAPRDTVNFVVTVEGEVPSSVSGKFAEDGRSVTLRGEPFGGDEPYTLARVTNFAARAKECKAASEKH